MKKLHRIVFLVFALISVGLMAWAIVVGMSAPDADKIADIVGMTSQYDENGALKEDEHGNPLPVLTTAEGIESMGVATINQMRKSDATIYGTTLEKINNIESKIAEIEEQLANNDGKALKEAQAKVAELEAVRRRTAEQNAALEAAKKTIEDINNLPKTLEELKAKMTWNADAAEAEKVLAMAEAEFKAVQDQIAKCNEAIEAKKGEFEPAQKLIEEFCQVAGIKVTETEDRADYVATYE